MRDTYATEMLFGNPSSNAHNERKNRAHPGIDIRWGSDSGFGVPQGFVATSHDRTTERVEAMNQVFIPSSLDDTRSPSPVSHAGTQYIGHVIKDEPDLTPRKRKQSGPQYVQETTPPDFAISKIVKKRKTGRRSSANTDPAPSETGGKRRKSVPASSAVKPSRENLTEDQKRENHIKSEQKRRSLIRDGFEDLGELVPGLRGGGFSKSAVLIMSAEWLEDLMQGNEVLRSRLEAMHG